MATGGTGAGHATRPLPCTCPRRKERAGHRAVPSCLVCRACCPLRGRPPATHTRQAPGTHRRAGGGMAGPMLLDHPRGTQPWAPLGWPGSSRGAGELGSWGAGLPVRPALPGSSVCSAASSPSHHMPAPAQTAGPLSPCAVLLQAKLIISNKPMFKLQNQTGAS